MCTWSPIYESLPSMSVTHLLTMTPFADFSDVTLADEDTNSILTDDANTTIPGKSYSSFTSSLLLAKASLYHSILFHFSGPRFVWENHFYFPPKVNSLLTSPGQVCSAMAKLGK